MADAPPSLPLYEVPYRRLFPWLRLFRCAGSAADPKRLMLAAVGILCLELSTRVFVRPQGWESNFQPGALSLETVNPIDFLLQLLEPARAVMSPLLAVFDPSASAWTFLLNACQGLWVLIVFGLIGGAIARIAVVDLAKQERVGLVEALRFSARKVVSLLGTPLVPLLGVVVVAALLAGFGLLYRLGTFGATVAGVLAFLPLIGGLLLTLIVIGLAAGWPLMHASVAAEAEDGFDAMSRAYAYVHQRPWNYAAYVALAIVIGGAGLVFVSLFASLVMNLSAWSLSFGGSPATVQSFYGANPAGGTLAASAHRFWLAVVALLARGWIYSYFWTAATAIYLLLRRDVDGTPWSTIAYQARTSPLHEIAAEPASPPTVPSPHAGASQRDPGEVAGV